MTGLLSLPPELLHEVVQLCPSRERCRLRTTCKVLSEISDPIVFRRLRLFDGDQHVTENQIIALATQSTKACEFTKVMKIIFINDNLRATEQSWPHFGPCDDLGVHLPTAISTLRNLTRFVWVLPDDVPSWLVNSLLQAVARLPQLTDLSVILGEYDARFPVDLFSNLSKLSVLCGYYEHTSFFIAPVATVIANSPHIRCLAVGYLVSVEEPLPTLSDLLAKVPKNKPLCLEHLSISYMNATVDPATLPHLTHLNSFEFEVRDEDLAARVWTSFLINNIKLSDVVVQGAVTKETMLYLSSFSGLKKLIAGPINEDDVKEMLFAEVLPKHVNSLQTLEFFGCNFDHSKAKSITSCLKLRDLAVCIDLREGMTVQLLLDTLACLPKLKILRVGINYSPPGWGLEPTTFKPKQGLRYVEELESSYFENGKAYQRRFILENDRGRPLRYREIPWM